MRAKMVATLAEHLDITYEKASEALNAVWSATMDIDVSKQPWSKDPNLQNPGVALAHRVQECLTREFSGEEIFPAVVVVQARDGHVGMAATAITVDQVEQLLRLGIGAARRNRRQHGTEES